MWKFKSKKDKRIEELEKELQVCKDDAWEMKVGLNAQIDELKRRLKNEMEYAQEIKEANTIKVVPSKCRYNEYHARIEVLDQNTLNVPEEYILDKLSEQFLPKIRENMEWKKTEDYAMMAAVYVARIRLITED